MSHHPFLQQDHKYKIASTILYHCKNQKVYCLLGKEGRLAKPNNQGKWCPLVGFFEPEKHKTVMDALCAETHEESGGCYSIDASVLEEPTTFTATCDGGIRGKKAFLFVQVKEVFTSQRMVENAMRYAKSDYHEKEEYDWICLEDMTRLENGKKSNIELRASFAEDMRSDEFASLLKRANLTCQ